MQYKSVSYEIQVKRTFGAGFVGADSGFFSMEKVKDAYEHFVLDHPARTFRILRVETVTTVVESTLGGS